MLAALKTSATRNTSARVGPGASAAATGTESSARPSASRARGDESPCADRLRGARPAARAARRSPGTAISAASSPEGGQIATRRRMSRGRSKARRAASGSRIRRMGSGLTRVTCRGSPASRRHGTARQVTIACSGVSASSAGSGGSAARSTAAIPICRPSTRASASGETRPWAARISPSGAPERRWRRSATAIDSSEAAPSRTSKAPSRSVGGRRERSDGAAGRTSCGSPRRTEGAGDGDMPGRNLRADKGVGSAKVADQG